MKLYKNAWFERFARKEKISDAALTEAIERADKGLVDADLGHGVIKLRVARAGQGKSSGYRTIVIYLKGNKAFFVYGFAKNKRDNIREDEKAGFKSLATHLINLTETEINALVEGQHFFEVKTDE